MTANVETIGRYKVLQTLGRGAMGVVYKAVDPVIDRVVAIKTIKLSLSPEELAFYEARFSQEIRTVGKLNHPNIVTIYDVGRTDEYAYMAMEFIDGPELKMVMKAGQALDVSTAIAIAAQTADGLALAHSRDIVHRDVKPSNIMLLFDEDGIVAKVTDFGIARAPTSSVKTMTGMILGSPRYMSPEQVVGKNVGPRSDVFSLGVVLYEMLSGMPPFDAESVSSIMYHTVHEREQPLSRANPEIPQAVADVVSRALAKSPDERFQTMKEFARALRELLRALPPPLPRLELAPTPLDTGPPAGAPTHAAPEAAHSLSLDFDSIAGTRRLAALTEQATELSPYLEALQAESKAEPAPAPTVPAKATHVPAASPAFPAASAAILGLLALTALALGLAILL